MPADPERSQPELKASTLDVAKRRKRVTLFKLGRLWVFKYFFDEKEIFRALGDSYNRNKFRFEFKSFGARNDALKVLEKAGFEYELVEDLRPFAVKLSRYSKYSSLLKSSVSYLETPDWRIFLMKDLSAVEEALRVGAEMYQGNYEMLVFS